MTSAQKRTCMDHQNMPNHQTSTCLECGMWLCRCKITRFTMPNMWLADLYAPQGVDMGGVGSSTYQCDTVQKRPESKTCSCKAVLIIFQWWDMHYIKVYVTYIHMSLPTYIDIYMHTTYVCIYALIHIYRFNVCIYICNTYKYTCIHHT